MQSSQEAVCRKIFLVLLAQLIFLAMWSLVAQSGPVFVQRAIFGYDFRDFYLGPRYWFHGINPYTTTPLNRFDKPPLILGFGMLFSWMPFGIATFSFFLLNLTIIFWSVRAFARKLDLSSQCVDLLTWITLLYYPVYFLLDRGNLEGVILGCLCLAFCTRKRLLRAFLFALTGGLKVYPLLLLVPAARNRKWRLILSILLILVLLQLPFYRFIPSFLHAMTIHRHYQQAGENISPAAIIIAALGERIGKWVYLIFWAGTLGIMLYSEQHAFPEKLIISFLPWMVAFPLQFFPYGGVLLLPVLAWKLHDLKDRTPNLWDKLFINGFLLVGVQATALTVYFQHGSSRVGDPLLHPPIFHWLNSLGMCLILCSLAISQWKKHRAAPADELENVEPLCEAV